MLEEALQNIAGMKDQVGSLPLLMPELLVVATIVALIIVGLFVEGRRSSSSLGGIALAGTLIALIAATGQFFQTSGSTVVFMGQAVIDRLGLFFKIVALASTAVVIFMSMLYPSLKRYSRVEYFTILLAATLGIMFVASSSNWIMLYLALETLSMASYITAGYAKFDSRSAEGSIKYLVYGAVASAFLLFGISLVYSLTGSLQLDSVLQVPGGLIGQIALLMIFVGIGFKMAAFPVHFWAPDVYEGAPTPITAYLAVASKAAGLIAAVRIFLPGVIEGTGQSAGGIGWEPIFWAVSILTMTVGNLAALRQNSLKRLLAYSSIAHAGYLMMAFTVPQPSAIEALLFYLAAYFVMNLGAFLVVVYLEAMMGTDEIDAFRGFVKIKPVVVVVLAILLFSLTGLPPTFGFVGKLLIFGVVIEAGLSVPEMQMFYFGLALIAGVNTAVSLYYYMKILKVMVLQQAEAKDDKAFELRKEFPRNWALAAQACIGVFGLATLWFGVFWAPLREAISTVVRS